LDKPTGSWTSRSYFSALGQADWQLDKPKLLLGAWTSRLAVGQAEVTSRRLDKPTGSWTSRSYFSAPEPKTELYLGSLRRTHLPTKTPSLCCFFGFLFGLVRLSGEIYFRATVPFLSFDIYQ